MTLHIEIIPVISLVAGVAILLFPRLLNYIVAAYLIASGVLGFIV